MFERVKYYVKSLNPLKKAYHAPPVTSEERMLISRIRSRRLTYLTDSRLASIASTCRSIEDAKMPGVLIEAGCALGGSSILIASVKKPDRALFVYDVFGLIPPPTKKDTKDVHDRYQTIVEGRSTGINGDKYYGYEENLYKIVESNFKTFGINTEEESISLIQGLVQDTLKVDRPVAFAHVDVDWYDPVKTCLKRIFPNLVVGGSIILDDYYDWGGCRKATNECLRDIAGQFVLDNTAGSLKITKVRSR